MLHNRKVYEYVEKERTLAAKLTDLPYLYIKTKMGVVGLIFEPDPPNFENQYNFCRC